MVKCACFLVMSCIIHTTADAWTLPKLKILFPKDAGEAQDPNAKCGEGSDVSGMVVESPHKTILTEKEFPCNISGVGQVSTSWIGKTGLIEMQNKVAETEAQKRGKNTACQLQGLATECLKAFRVMDTQKSTDPQIQKAISLCMQYTHRTEERTVTSSIASLWKGQGSQDMQPCATPESIATKVLGESLVSTITEKKRTPPDVSCHVELFTECATCLVCSGCDRCIYI